MRQSRFTVEQITLALRQAEAGMTVGEICRKLQITETTFYRWKRKYGGLGVLSCGSSDSCARRTASSSSWWPT